MGRHLLFFKILLIHYLFISYIPATIDAQQHNHSSGSTNSALASLFVEQEADCDHDHDDEPSFISSDEHTTIGFHGAAVQLSCSVAQLNHRAVSWIRKTHDDLHLLTVGEAKYTADPRIEAQFIYPHQWILKFNPALKNDSGNYLCHVSTDPPMIRSYQLEMEVLEPIVEVLDNVDAKMDDTIPAPNKEQIIFYRAGASFELVCRVSRFWIKPKQFYWLKSGKPMNDDLWKGGISIYTEVSKPGQLVSHLSIANASGSDEGNYTCVIDFFSASAVVHLIKEEKPAASQHAVNCAVTFSRNSDLAKLILILLLLKNHVL